MHKRNHKIVDILMHSIIKDLMCQKHAKAPIGTFNSSSVHHTKNHVKCDDLS